MTIIFFKIFNKINSFEFQATHDESRQIRLRGAEALGKLALHHARIEPLVTELRNAIMKAEEPEYYCTYAHALRLVIEGAGKKVSVDGKQAIIDLMEENIRLGRAIIYICTKNGNFWLILC